jgi:dnd system-associated protein 4
MATVYVSKAHKDLAERLAGVSTKMAGKPIFQTYMHLMVFAAMVGYSNKRSESLESRNRGAEVYDRVFDNHRMDGVAFLMALDQEQDGEILRDSRDNECWRIIESYAEAGFQIIQQWLLDQPSDVDGVETILARMAQNASERVKQSPEPLSPDISF